MSAASRVEALFEGHEALLLAPRRTRRLAAGGAAPEVGQFGATALLRLTQYLLAELGVDCDVAQDVGVLRVTLSLPLPAARVRCLGRLDCLPPRRRGSGRAAPE
jgi:hypothetical protein